LLISIDNGHCCNNPYNLDLVNTKAPTRLNYNHFEAIRKKILNVVLTLFINYTLPLTLVLSIEETYRSPW